MYTITHLWAKRKDGHEPGLPERQLNLVLAAFNLYWPVPHFHKSFFYWHFLFLRYIITDILIVLAQQQFSRRVNTNLITSNSSSLSHVKRFINHQPDIDMTANSEISKPLTITSLRLTCNIERMLLLPPAPVRYARYGFFAILARIIQTGMSLCGRNWELCVCTRSAVTPVDDHWSLLVEGGIS